MITNRYLRKRRQEKIVMEFSNYSRIVFEVRNINISDYCTMV